MINNFNNYLLLEKLGIHNDLFYLSEFIYNKIKDNYENIIINGKDLKTEKLKIFKIHIVFNDLKHRFGSFDLTKSKMTDKGFIIYMELDKNEINKDTIYHELQHSIDFYYQGKEDMIKKTFNLKSSKLVSGRYNEKEFENFVSALYFSQLTEINSYVAQTYYYLLNVIKTEKNFNKVFSEIIKTSECYMIYKFLKNYNVYELKNVDNDELIMFFNLIDDSNKFLLKNIKNNIFNKIKSTLYAISIILNKDNYYKKIKKRYKNINDVEKILNFYDNKFKKSANIYEKKLHRLYDLIKNELKNK